MNQPPATRPRFDSNRAWQEGSSAVAGNRDALLALAGVFIVVPTFALTTLAPFPAVEQGKDATHLLEALGVYFDEHWLAVSAVIVAQFIGTLCMLALISERSRPTVSEAIRLAFRFAPPFLAGMALIMLAMPIIASVPGALLGISGVAALSLLGLGAGFVLAFYGLSRLSLFGPAVLTEQRFNPFAALRRSLELTRDNGWRLTTFLVLLTLAFRLVGLLIVAAASLLTTVAAGPESAAVVAAFFDSVMQGAYFTFLVAVLSAAYRQLAEPR
ncbi:MAG TPA: hypothetical protein VFV30_02990 [Novosphingobium sp.]|nr:hypothetical protein [Novosphingobium sp.]